jgi:hypothetical protein
MPGRARYPPFCTGVDTMLIKAWAIQIWEFCAPASRYGQRSLACLQGALTRAGRKGNSVSMLEADMGRG